VSEEVAGGPLGLQEHEELAKFRGFCSGGFGEKSRIGTSTSTSLEWISFRKLLMAESCLGRRVSEGGFCGGEEVSGTFTR